jgi:predicted AAA+ superfamily ATPase
MGFADIQRQMEPFVRSDLKEKMVFISGPRQVGKTTLSKSLLGKSGTYLNWDFDAHRERILKSEWPIDKGILVLDEIHKYKNWRNTVKGVFDVLGDKISILVTGSAKLDTYRRSGDSLQGRYHHYRMHPLSISELDWKEKTILDLLRLGGFPEPFFSGSDVKSKRWRKDHRTRIIREELASVEQFQDLGTIELLAMRLPNLIGSAFSINAIREDLQVAHKTVDKWLTALDSLYYTYRLLPFGAPTIKAVKKEKKLYLWDWSVIEEIGIKFENWIASELLYMTHHKEDTLGEEWELRYFRDSEKREVDFVLIKDQKPFAFVECKLSETNISPHLRYLKHKFKEVPTFQIYLQGKKSYINEDGIYHLPALEFLRDYIWK